MEQGDVVSIPMQISQSNLSINYQFYETTLSLIMEDMPPQVKHLYKLKN